MTRIITLKLEVPADDDVPVNSVKDMMREHIRQKGRVENVGAAEDGQSSLDRVAFFDAAAVKLWTQRERAPSNGKKPST